MQSVAHGIVAHEAAITGLELGHSAAVAVHDPNTRATKYTLSGFLPPGYDMPLVFASYQCNRAI